MPDSRPILPFSPPADIDTNAITEPFWTALRDGRLTVQRCADCHRFRMPPSRHCPNCRSTRDEWPELSGRGRLYSYTIAALNPREPAGPVYVAALVCPDEAPDTRIFANIVECTIDDLAIDLRVELQRDERGADIALFAPIRTSGERVAA